MPPVSLGIDRRGFLKGLGTTLSLTAGGWFLPRGTDAADMSLRDRVDLLYSNQFAFDRTGEPLVSIGLLTGQEEVFVTAPRGLVLLPSGTGGTEISIGRRVRFSLAGGTPARERYSVVLEERPWTDAAAAELAAKRWRDLGFETELREVGTLFGIGGQVLDIRAFLVTHGAYAQEAEAAAAARDVAAKHGALGHVHPVTRERGAGTIVAHDLDHDVRVKLHNVVWIEATHGDPISIERVPTDSAHSASREETRSYRGELYVAIDRTGRLCAANLASETDILCGLVPAEIFASAPHEALAAQAIAARGQLLAKVGTRHLSDPFLLCSEQHCQVYVGTKREHPRTNEAVRSTRGHVLMRDGRAVLVDTVYCANSGGHTEDNDRVWPSAPDASLRGRIDPLAAREFPGALDAETLSRWLRSAPKTYSRPARDDLMASYRWSATLDPAAIAQALASATSRGRARDVGTVRDLVVTARGCSGRATTMLVRGSKGETEIKGELAIRRLLGGLRSSMFIVEPDRDRYGRFALIGGGHGHGVGLCQHGSMGMALAGRSHLDILGHYYAGSKVDKLW